jgi:hypothetical protein
MVLYVQRKVPMKNFDNPNLRYLVCNCSTSSPPNVSITTSFPDEISVGEELGGMWGVGHFHNRLGDADYAAGLTKWQSIFDANDPRQLQKVMNELLRFGWEAGIGERNEEIAPSAAAQS